MRVIKFDFDALCRKIVEICPGARSINSYEKKEGGFNRVFIFYTDNAKRIVARLPFKLAGPVRLTTNSEVATIKYCTFYLGMDLEGLQLISAPCPVQAETSIPIPQILDWSDDASNAIGSEYIIMEHALGVSLHEKWPTMDVDDQIRCIKAVSQNVKEMVDIDFAAYGSLYFADTPYLGDSMLPLNKDFCIGPHCGAIRWNCNPSKPRYYHSVTPNHGPCKLFKKARYWYPINSNTGQDLTAYCGSLVDTGISKLPPAQSIAEKPRYQGSINTHEELLEQGRAVIHDMIKDSQVQNAAKPVLFHPDLHKRNIFVSEEDPTVITAIIDWQGSSIEPAFWYSDDVPDFAQPVLDPSGEEYDPKSEACAKTYELCTQVFTPKLSVARSMDEAYFRPFQYCYRTWDDGAAAFREELIQTSRRWEELGFSGPCPFPFPRADELKDHQKDYKRFEAAQQLRTGLCSLLNTASDGWVPPEEWEATKIAHHETFEAMLQRILESEELDEDEPIQSEEDLREIWPFDLKA